MEHRRGKFFSRYLEIYIVMYGTRAAVASLTKGIFFIFASVISLKIINVCTWNMSSCGMGNDILCYVTTSQNG